MTRPDTVDAVVVGAGFAGLYMLHRLRLAGLSARVFEAGGGVGVAFIHPHHAARRHVPVAGVQRLAQRALMHAQLTRRIE